MSPSCIHVARPSIHICSAIPGVMTVPWCFTPVSGSCFRVTASTKLCCPSFSLSRWSPLGQPVRSLSLNGTSFSIMPLPSEMAGKPWQSSGARSPSKVSGTSGWIYNTLSFLQSRKNFYLFETHSKKEAQRHTVPSVGMGDCMCLTWAFYLILNCKPMSC